MYCSRNAKMNTYNFWNTLSKLNDWVGGWIETKCLDSTPGMKEKIKRGMKTPLDECYEMEEIR